MDSVTVDKVVARLGEEKNLGVECEDVRQGSDLSAVTATLSTYDSTGAVVTALSAVAATVAASNANTHIRITYLVTFGAGKNITTAGTYRNVWRITKGSTIREVQQPLEVLAAPS